MRRDGAPWQQAPAARVHSLVCDQKNYWWVACDMSKAMPTRPRNHATCVTTVGAPNAAPFFFGAMLDG
jgi:hypothetical protein